MIAVARKIPILRYCLVIALFSLLFVGTEYLYLHYKKAQLLRSNIERVISSHQNSALIDSCIYKLYSADNNSRLYTITGNRVYLHKYSADIDNVLITINKVKFSDQDIPNSEKFLNLVLEKTVKTNKYIKLRRLTDSLIRSSKTISKSLDRLQKSKPVVVAQHITTFDTVKTPAPAKHKKSFIGRLFAAMAKKKEEKTKPVIVTKDTVIYSHEIAKSTIQSGKEVYNYYKKLSVANNKLQKGELQILELNNKLVDEIVTGLRNYKSIEQSYIDHSKTELRDNMADVFADFNNGSTINFILLTLLLIIVFYNLWKIFRNEQQIIDYSNSAEEYAQLKSNFLAGMSHEIRTPLNSVIGFSEQLSQESLSLSQKEQVLAIRNSSEMILDLVNEILDFSKYETGKMNFESSPFMLDQTIDEVFATVNIHALKKHILLERTGRIDENICCEGDKMRLKQVLMNLLGNAIKFTRQGKVTLNANIEMTLPDKIILLVSVTDTGIGIDKEDLPHVFDEFSQVAKAQNVTRHKGTGLGLAICKKIVELQGGSIEVASTPGVGSIFSFELPLKQLENNDCIIESSMSDDLIGDYVKDKFVLLVDDNKLNVLLARTILKKWGVKCDVAYDGSEAFELFKLKNYDMVLTDIQMPVMDGLQLITHIREFSDPVKSKIIIMALTANVMKEDRDIYLSTGANDIILKPFLEKDLVEKIAVAIQNNTTALRFIA
ncbi:response regulator [Mucilaginibacter corticis]|uniref:histidine kinase n=1 Tax=Mucilaginibacter corticis TaxID=2597670 RepID=A0A556MBU5_9SPHI|nr:response regulator [Mucilaginibacter corticis]